MWQNVRNQWSDSSNRGGGPHRLTNKSGMLWLLSFIELFGWLLQNIAPKHVLEKNVDDQTKLIFITYIWYSYNLHRGYFCMEHNWIHLMRIFCVTDKKTYPICYCRCTGLPIVYMNDVKAKIKLQTYIGIPNCE